MKISPNSLMVSRLLDKVNAMPESRPEVVSEFQDRLSRGNYPAPMLVDGLTELIGGALTMVPENKSGTNTPSSPQG